MFGFVLFKNIEEKVASKKKREEDCVVFNFLKKIKNIENVLDVGSGLGEFAILLNKKFDFNLRCIEINKELARITQNKGIETDVENILKNNYSDNYFDVVHCAHLIEHFYYPDVAYLLDELVRITKINGYIIIRSPLMHPDFYWDIDHVRPYPPKTILTYFSNPQQQKVGKFKIKKVFLWYRYPPFIIFPFSKLKIIIYLNNFLKLFWLRYGFPKKKKNGYILILKKIK